MNILPKSTEKIHCEREGAIVLDGTGLSSIMPYHP